MKLRFIHSFSRFQRISFCVLAAGIGLGFAALLDARSGRLAASLTPAFEPIVLHDLKEPEGWFVGKAFDPNRWILLHVAADPKNDPEGPSFGSIVEVPADDSRVTKLTQAFESGKVTRGSTEFGKKPVRSVKALPSSCWRVEFEHEKPQDRTIETWCFGSGRALVWVEGGAIEVPSSVSERVIAEMRSAL